MQKWDVGTISPSFYEQLLSAKIPQVQKDSQVKQFFALTGPVCKQTARKQVGEMLCKQILANFDDPANKRTLIALPTLN